MVSFYPKDKEIEKLLDRLTKNTSTYTKNSRLVMDLGRFKEIRFLREKNKLFIGKDHRKNISIIFVKKPIKKKGNGFIF